MADMTFSYAIVMVPQSVAGTINAAIPATPGSWTEASGTILGDPESGDGESGISIGLTRNLREKASVGEFTLPASDYLGLLAENFSVAIPMKGNGATASGTPADSEFSLALGPKTLHECCGLLEEDWSGGVGKAYKIGTKAIASVGIWVGNVATGDSMKIMLKDVTGTPTISNDPATVGIFSASLSGTVHDVVNEARPTFTYGVQSTLSAPSVVDVGHAWSTTRSFTSMNIAFTASEQTVPRSNASSGEETRATGRSIDITTSMMADDADVVFESDQLQLTTAPTDAMLWTVGTPAIAAATINSYQINIPTPEVRSLQPNVSGDEQVYDLTLRAINAAAGEEFELIYL